MQKFEILLNRSYSASTQSIPSAAGVVSAEVPVVSGNIFESQQQLTFQKEYFLYLQQNGVSLVNNLNVKSYLNESRNQDLAAEFIEYLKENTSHQEYIDILYDSNKLSDYFNDYYKKFQNFSNQGVGSATSDETVNLEETKKRLTQQDQLYVKTNSLTNYHAEEYDQYGQLVQAKKTSQLSPSDFYNFSGDDQSYYINIVVNHGRKTFFSDDFSQYYQDSCDGTIIYNKYTYFNNVNTDKVFFNYSAAVEQQKKLNLVQGPSQKSIDLMKKLLPINYLSDNITNNDSSIGLSYNVSDQFQQQDFANQYGFVVAPQNNSLPSGKIINFTDFNSFSEYFGFYYYSWTPQFSDPEALNKRYIYQQTLNMFDQLKSIYANASPDDRVRVRFELGVNLNKDYYAKFDNVPNYYRPEYIGQEFDSLNVNKYRIRVNHTDQTTTESIILKWEPFSVGQLGADDGFNFVSFDVLGNTDPNIDSIKIEFQASDVYQDVFVNLYKNWPTRTPIVFSIRPEESPSLILEYLVIYLEEFYENKKYTFNDRIDVTSSEVCNLMYNSFVYRDYDDNFLEFLRPDNISVNFINTTGITLTRTFETNNIQSINSKLIYFFPNNSIKISSISKAAGTPESGIYNIYVWGSNFFGNSSLDYGVELLVVADGQIPVRKTQINDTNILIYTPQRFQQELEQVVYKDTITGNMTDIVFSIYNSSEQSFKVLERIQFLANNSKDIIKKKAAEFRKENMLLVEEGFFKGDIQFWQIKLWEIFKNLVFSEQFIKNGQITDRYAANVYSEDIKAQNFKNYLDLLNYFDPKIEILYSNLIAL